MAKNLNKAGVAVALTDYVSAEQIEALGLKSGQIAYILPDINSITEAKAAECVRALLTLNLESGAVNSPVRAGLDKLLRVTFSNHAASAWRNQNQRASAAEWLTKHGVKFAGLDANQIDRLYRHSRSLSGLDMSLVTGRDANTITALFHKAQNALGITEHKDATGAPLTDSKSALNFMSAAQMLTCKALGLSFKASKFSPSVKVHLELPSVAMASATTVDAPLKLAELVVSSPQGEVVTPKRARGRRSGK